MIAPLNMRTLTALLLSLSVAALAWVAGLAIERGITVKVVFLHVIASPEEIKQ